MANKTLLHTNHCEAVENAWALDEKRLKSWLSAEMRDNPHLKKILQQHYNLKDVEETKSRFSRVRKLFY